MPRDGEAMIDPRVPAPVAHVVDPEGRIRSFRLVRNVTHQAVDANGDPRPAFAELGWVRLDTLYAKDGPEDGLEAWESYCARKGKAGSFPTELLPKEVVRRREAAAAGWQPPKKAKAKGAKA